MKSTTILAIVLIAIAVIAIVGVDFSFKGTPGLVYAGRVKANFIEVKHVDGTTYQVLSAATTTVTSRVIHGRNMDYNDKVGTISSGSITGDIAAEDNGLWYLVIDYTTNTTQWLDIDETLKSNYVSRIFGYDGDIDGFLEDYVELDFSGLEALKAGEDKKEVEVTLIYCPARVASIAFVSLTNVSAISTTAYNYYSATGYTSGFSEGDMAKIAKIEIQFNSTSATYVDTEQWRLTHLKLGPYTFTVTQFGSFDLANYRFQILFGDQINHQGGKPMYYAKNAGTLWATYELKAYCKYAAADKDLNDILIEVFVYEPDGSITSAFSRLVDFTSET